MDPTADNLSPETMSELRRLLAENAGGAGRPLVPIGGGTGGDLGRPVLKEAIRLATAGLNRVADYPARDMTVTVEAGCCAAELAGILATENQRLPIDVPQPQRATVGGMVATNVSGPRRFGYGTLRDYVIGVTAVDAQGREFHGGGRVVKNVAGYDLCKLMLGSLGTLAVLTQITFKLRPLPEQSALLWMTFDSLATVEKVLEALTVSAARPVALEVFDPLAAAAIAMRAQTDVPSSLPVLCVGVDGTQREVDWQIGTLKAECSSFGPSEVIEVPDPQSGPLWQSFTEFQCDRESPLSFKANLVPSRTIEFLEQAARLGVTVQAHAGNGIVIGRLPEACHEADRASETLAALRKRARAGRGNLVILHCAEQWKRHLPVFGDPPPSWPLMRKLKAELDPDNLLSPGRMFAPDAETTGEDHSPQSALA